MRALEGLRGAGRHGQGDLAAAQPVRGGGLLPGGHRRGVEQPGPLRRRPLRPSRGGPRRPDRHVLPVARRGLRRRGQAPHHARHLRPVQRLQGCLLSQGAEGAPADPRRFRQGLRRVRRGRWGRPRRRAAFKIGETTDDPLAMYLSDIYTISCNLAGIAGHQHPVRLHEERACRSACKSRRRRSRRRSCCAWPACTSGRPTGTPAGPNDSRLRLSNDFTPCGSTPGRPARNTRLLPSKRSSATEHPPQIPDRR